MQGSVVGVNGYLLNLGQARSWRCVFRSFFCRLRSML